MDLENGNWTLAFADLDALERSLKKLPSDAVLAVVAQFERDLRRYGLEVFNTGAAKWLGGGLAGYRYRRNPDLLIRLFFTIEANQVILVLSGYDKMRDSSHSRQQTEIIKARKALKSLHKK